MKPLCRSILDRCIMAIIFSAFLTSYMPQASAMQMSITGRASVIDADTIEIHNQRIRLYGIDAPEKRQPCFMSNGSPWRCGQKGASALYDLISTQSVTCTMIDTDQYNRIVARCYVGGKDVNGWLVEQGWAMAYRRYSTDYVLFEQIARKEKRGIWIGKVQPPWEWRRKQSAFY